jgi:DNA-binding CsgD family transcriptional regulator
MRGRPSGYGDATDREIARMLGEGRGLKEIGAAVGLSRSGVSWRIRRMRRALGLYFGDALKLRLAAAQGKIFAL